jgi:D-amino-acid dehydrogenase
VTVIDRSNGVADGTSFANAGQLSYSFTDSLARPEFLRNLPSLLLGRDPGIRLRGIPSPALLRWGSAFLRQCTAAQARNNTVAVLQLAMRSAWLMEQLMAAVPLEFSFLRAGKLVLLSQPGELEQATKTVLLKEQHGCSTEVLSRDAALQIEPALAHMRDDFIAAIYSRNDHVADARAFTVGLADWLQNKEAVEFKLGETISRIVTKRDRVCSVITDRSEYSTEIVVVCLGTGSPDVLRPLRIDPAICPVRGYSVTLPFGEQAPSVSVSDTKNRIVLSRLGKRVRIAGFADFVGFDTRHDRARTDALLAIARGAAPLAADYDVVDAERWAGLRPMTPDGRPRVGPTRVRGLFLNTGHGMLGWTLACATGYELAEIVS